jgi:hypothetical protein
VEYHWVDVKDWVSFSEEFMDMLVDRDRWDDLAVNDCGLEAGGSNSYLLAVKLPLDDLEEVFWEEATDSFHQLLLIF